MMRLEPTVEEMQKKQQHKIAEALLNFKVKK
jgi:hypothetical protein